MRSPVLICTYLLFQLFLFGCNKQDNEVGQRVTSLSKSEVTLDHGNLLLNSQINSRSIVGIDSMLFLDPGSQQFILFDLKTKKHLLTIPIAVAGPDFFDFPIYDVQIEANNLYVLSKSFFSIYNLSGENLSRLGKDEIDGYNLDYKTSDFQLVDSDSIIFNRIPMKLVYGQPTSSIIDSSIFFTYSQKHGLDKNLDIISPSEALLADDAEGYFQDFAKHTFLLSNDSIIYTYPFTSKTFIFDVGSGKYHVKETNSNLVPNTRKPARSQIIPTPDWIKYVYSDVKYSPLEQDEASGFFARVVYEFKTEPDGKEYNTKYLMVLDSELNVIHEVEIDELVWDKPLISNSIIYLLKVNQSKENAYQFLVYQIKNQSPE